GVTAILPHAGNLFREKVAAGVYTVNGFGKPTGFEQIRELGVIETPILLTNTLNVPRVADALIAYMLRDNPDIGVTTGSVNPVVGECNDGFLNDLRGRHVSQAHVWRAIETASDGAVAEGNVGAVAEGHVGAVAEGNVGAGTGTACFQFKGGIGTASRVVLDGRFTVGALVQTNYGVRAEMMMYGVPLGAHLLNDHLPQPGPGSIMLVIATDAPLDARQLTRCARRAAIALGRTGTVSRDGSGEFAIAFSTANRWLHDPDDCVEAVTRFHDGKAITEVFLGVVEALEEAIWNAAVAAETMTGRDGNTLSALPHDEIIKWFDYYRRRTP
ncbi:MAG: P1 family peptidase, partial [Anaerolineae bacterium]|nr:P1 family peptidase [Anaerolineae bacterium]